ncbi:MAG: hypothetical protein EBT03_11950, partial [Betaproteobacteria bacterium]|nr:hypothetical protein [Betaproteobacteria bacterium]
MPLTWVEDNASRSATIVRLGRKAASSYSKSYKVFGTTDDTEVHAEANGYITGTLAYWQYPGQPNVQLRAESYSVSYLGDNAWQVTISYEKQGADDDDQRDPLKRARSFDTSGGTQHITQAESGTASSGVATDTPERRYGTNAPDMKGAIGVDGNSVNGVDIVVPALTWTESYDVPHSYVTSNWIKGVAALTGSVNNAAFRGFAAYEVLFMGASGSQEWDDERGNGPWSLQFKFVASPNVTGKTIGDVTGIEKKGHEYLWVRYEDAVDSDTLIKK